MTARSLPPTTTGATAPRTRPRAFRTSIRATSLTVASPSSGLLTVMIPSGSVPVGSNGMTTGGRVLGGRFGRVLRASELVMVRAPVGSMSSRK